MVVVSVSFGAIAVLSTSIGLISFLLPNMMAELGADIRHIQWVQTAFMLTMVVLLPTVDWLGAIFGQKRLYLFGLTIFTLSTILCTFAWNLPSMILFRVIQGIGAGLFFPLGTPFIFDAFLPQRRGIALGVNTLLFGLGSILGSSLVAYLADIFGWRWGFYYLIPLSTISLILGIRLLRERPLPKPGRFDITGCISLAISLISFVLFITQKDVWSFKSNVFLGLIFILSTIIFFIVENHTTSPFVDLTIYRHSPYLAGSILGFLVSSASVGIYFLLPIYLQKLLGYSIFQTGLLTIPSSLSMLVLMPLTGWISDKKDARFLIGTGILGFAFSLFILSSISFYTSGTTLALVLVGIGISGAFIYTPLSNTMFSSLPHESIRLGSGLYALTRTLGRAIGSAVLSVMFTNRLSIQFTLISESITISSTAYRIHLERLSKSLQSLSFNQFDINAEEILIEKIWEEAAISAFGDCYFLLTFCFLLALIPVKFLKRQFN